MAHRRRAELVEDLVARLDAPVDVVWDERNNEWDTARRALLAAGAGSTHHLVLQDDAIVCRDLVAGLEAALAHVPARSPVSLYVGRKRPLGNTLPAIAERADADRSRWLVLRDINWGVGLCFPTAIVAELVAESDGLSVAEYDARVSAYFARRGMPVYHTWPSLVDHRDGASLLDGRAREGRVAYRFVGEGASALDLDWSQKVTRLEAPVLVSFRSLSTGKIASVRADSPAVKRYRRRLQHWVEESFNEPART